MEVHVDSQLKSHARKGNLGMVQVEGPLVPRQSIYVVEQTATARERRAGVVVLFVVVVVVVVQGSIAHRGQARWSGNSPEYFVKAVAAAAAGAHDPLAEYQTNRLRHHGEVVAGPAFAFASLVHHDQGARTGSRHQHVRN